VTTNNEKYMEFFHELIPEGAGILDVITRRFLMDRKKIKVCNSAVFYPQQKVEIWTRQLKKKRGTVTIDEIRAEDGTLKFKEKLPFGTRRGDALVVVGI